MKASTMHQHYEAMQALMAERTDSRLVSMARALSMTSAVLLDTDGSRLMRQATDDYEMLRDLSSAYTVPLPYTEEGRVEVHGTGTEVCIDINLGFTERAKPGIKRQRDPGTSFTIDRDEDGGLMCTALVFPYSAERQLGRLNDPAARIYRGKENPPGLYYPARALWLGKAAVEFAQ